MPRINWKIALLLLLPATEAQAQMSGCVRDATGALQCTLQRTQPQQGSIAPLRRIPRPDLSAEAWRRSSALAERRRESLEQQRREADEQRARLRQECLDRAAAGRVTGCSF